MTHETGEKKEERKSVWNTICSISSDSIFWHLAMKLKHNSHWWHAVTVHCVDATLPLHRIPFMFVFVLSTFSSLRRRPFCFFGNKRNATRTRLKKERLIDFCVIEWMPSKSWNKFLNSSSIREKKINNIYHESIFINEFHMDKYSARRLLQIPAHFQLHNGVKER